jgi:DNA-binding ferritin-like protein
MDTSHSSLKCLLDLWAHLRAAHHVYWTLHWQSRGPTAYADHLLFERLYEARVEEIDGLAEIIAGEYGSDKLEPVAAWAAASDIISKLVHCDTPVMVATMVLASVEECNADCAKGCYPASTQNFIAGVGTSHLSALYLLQQRFGRATSSSKK